MVFGIGGGGVGGWADRWMVGQVVCLVESSLERGFIDCRLRIWDFPLGDGNGTGENEVGLMGGWAEDLPLCRSDLGNKIRGVISDDGKETGENEVGLMGGLSGDAAWLQRSV